MAVSEQTPYIEHVANGITTSFALEFDCDNRDHLIVLVDDVESVVGAWSLSNGAVVFNTAPANGKKITIQRNTPASRSTNFQSSNNSFRPETINKDFDRVWLKIQELGVGDWLLDLKLQKFRDDVNLTALEDTLEQAQEIKNDTEALAEKVQDNVEQSQTLLINTTAQANAAADSAAAAATAKTQAEQSVTDANGIKSDMHTALYSFQNGAIRAYPTLAAANADIANIALNTKVSVLSATNGGDYYKASSEATSLTKSAFDPVEQAKADATTKANAAEANAKGYTDTLDTKIGYYQTENIFNPAQSTAVGFYANGVPNGQAGSIAALDYYPVIPDQKFWIRGFGGTTVIAVYDKDKVSIGNIDIRNAVEGVLTVASSYGGKTPAFIRLSSYNTASLSTLGFGYGDVLPPTSLGYGQEYGVLRNPSFYNELSSKIITSENNQLISVNREISIAVISEHLAIFENIFDPTKEMLQGFFTAGSYVSPYATSPNSYISLEFFPIPKNRKFFTFGLGASGNFIQLCGINKNPVAVVNVNTIVGNIYTVPLKAGSGNVDIHYIRFGTALGLTHIRDGNVAIGYANDKGVLPANPPRYGTPTAELSDQLIQSIASELNVSQSSLNGKKWVAMGDSITNTTYSTFNYCDVLATRHGATVVKHSANGATVHRKTSEDTQRILSESYVDISTTNPPDIITIAAGTNDLTTENISQLGVMSDRTTATFYGALHVLLSGLRSRFVDARIGYIAPIPRETRFIEGDATNKIWLKYKAIKEVCAYYGIPVWNGYVEFGANPLDSAAWKTKYMPDGLHPNDLGHIWYANRLEDFILSLAK